MKTNKKPTEPKPSESEQAALAIEAAFAKLDKAAKIASDALAKSDAERAARLTVRI